MTTRKKYSREFKLDATSLVLEQGYTRAEAARSLEINANMLGRWIQECQGDDGQAFRGNGKLTEEQAEIRRLREENRRLKMEKEILKKATVFFGKRNALKYAFITQNKKTWPVDVMCRLLGVSRHAYYQHGRRQQNKQPDPDHQAMLTAIKDIGKGSGYSYGSRRMRWALNALGYPVGRIRARSLMREAGVRARYRRKYKATTNSNHKQPVFENLLAREFAMDKPDQAYVTDITYIWTQEGWLYLVVFIDLFNRQVVGWSMGSRMNARLVTDALRMAMWRRQPEAGLILHSDQGSQYASKAYRRLLKANGFVGSMSRKGNCWDNAVAESFFASLKKERVQWKHYQTRAEAQQDILDYIVMFYNSWRLHSYLDYNSPNDYESAMAEQKKVA
ncbi:MAG: IS3 family transposase [Ketobacter sp.]